GGEHEPAPWTGPVLELVTDSYLRTAGPDILGEPPDFEEMLARLRAERERAIGDALLDQRLVAGKGKPSEAEGPGGGGGSRNPWEAEALWEARVSPWRGVGELGGGELRAVLEDAHRLMRTALDGPRPLRHVYRRAGRACPRCGGVIRSAPQGDNARMAYWCAGCQVGGNAPPS